MSLKIEKKTSGLVYILITALLLVFSNSCEKDDPKSVALLTAIEVTEITQTTAITGGIVSDDGGAPVTVRGICWSTNKTPTIDDSKTINGTGKGSFTISITDLKPGTIYYARAYAINNVGTSYSNEISFTTLEAIELPVLAKTNVIEITQTTAVFGSEITCDGGAPVTARGVCWSTSESPTIDDFKTINGKGKGSFSCNIEDLEPGTTYYVRTYALNSMGTSYCDAISFKTLEAIELSQLETIDITKITHTSAASGGIIINDGGAPVTVRGVCWSTSESPTIEDRKTIHGKGATSFNCNMKDLAPNTTYNVRAYATNSEGTSYGNTISFKTIKVVELGTVITTVANRIMPTTAVSGGNITDDGGAAISARGVCWSTNETPTINDSKTLDGTGKGSFTSNVANLKPNTTYYVRAYATNSIGTSYGSVSSFKTLKVIEFATLTTTEASKITQTTVVIGGNVVSDGGVSVTARGVCWSKNETPTIDNNKTMNGTGIGSFTSNIGDLEPNITYYVRAYATNSVGTKYGNTVAFTTLEAISLCELATTDITKITQTSAASGGKIKDDDGATPTARGICWSTNETPTIEDRKTINSKGTGVFNCNMKDLDANTTYYVRAYATNSEGTSYGNTVSFETLKAIEIATLTTTDAARIMHTTAVSGGNISDDGGAPITARGVCWSINETPTINDSKTLDGTGNGSFTSNVANLKPNTTYYIRAYATNSIGTSYGSVSSFKTLKVIELPTITTVNATKITQISAVSGGNVVSDGGVSVTARGVCWSTNETPTIDNSKTMNGSGIGSFSSNIADLKPNTTYYVRAYATNSVGTSYSNAISFTTEQDDKNVVDGDGNVYKTVTIGKQTWMTENLKTTKYNDGTAIPMVADNYAWQSSTTHGYSWYMNDTSNKSTYGALYNWYTVSVGKLCPIGWHVPSDAEWATLNTYLGGHSVAGGKLKEKGSANWRDPNIDATNESGFTALPGGHRYIDGTFTNREISGHWWSSTEFSNKNAGIWDIFYLAGNLTKYDDSKKWGCSVRCVRD